MSRRQLGLVFGLFVLGCGDPGAAIKTPAVAPASLKDEIPADHLREVLDANRRGVGHLERFEYAEASNEFRKVRSLAPGWHPGSVNLAIALLNDSGVQAELSRKSGADANAFSSNFDEALSVLDDLLRRDPKNLHAHYCRGIVLQYLQADPKHPENLVRAHDDFVAVTEGDPTDANAWYQRAMTLYDPATRDDPEGAHRYTSAQIPERIAYLTKATECNPYSATAFNQLHQAYREKGDTATQRELIARWRRLDPNNNPASPGELIANFYGGQGRYATAIDPMASRGEVVAPTPSPRFDATKPIDVALPPGDRWARRSDFAGDLALIGRLRDRFGAAVSTFDADGDGRLDLFLVASVVGSKGLRDALLINKGDGRFVDASAALKLPDDRPSLGVAAGDFDADKRVDLLLTGVGLPRLLRNLGTSGFVDVTTDSGIRPDPAIGLTARWMDLDQDGDLDLYVVNIASVDAATSVLSGTQTPGAPNRAYRNDGRPPSKLSTGQIQNWVPLATSTESSPPADGLSLVMTPWPEPSPIDGGIAPHTGVAMLDVDNDRDLDLVLTADGQPPTLVINDRLGAFRASPLTELGDAPSRGILSADFDKDGKIDLAIVGDNGAVSAWRNVLVRGSAAVTTTPSFERLPSGAKGWLVAAAADVDLDTWTDLVGLTQADRLAPLAWARNAQEALIPQDLPTSPDGEGRSVGIAFGDLIGDGLPDLFTARDGEAPRLARNLGNGMHWTALGLGGRWKVGPDQMRTNPEGLGTRVSLDGAGLDVEYCHATPDSGLAQSAGPIVLGLGTAREVTLLHLRWPDGVLQCELNPPIDSLLSIAENNRKTGSCPVLFTWNGRRFTCLGDFLGGGGLGYLVAPGLYGQPDRDESVAITTEQLKPVDGVLRISITEPMDEVAYLDHLTLDVVDRPPGVSATPNERFAPDGPRPDGSLIAWSRSIAPLRSTGGSGRDLTETLRDWDRKTADDFDLLRGWVGYAQDHSVILDFGDLLADFPADAPLTLCLAGWVEYPYSQTNYAAATAGHVLRPPVLERQRDDGSWDVVDPTMGYPAGLPRRMTVDLTGKVGGPRCVLRISTNMECYWDQAFVAVREPATRLAVRSLPVARASLGYRGYMREVSPDGRAPLLYDYDFVDPAPLAHLTGNLTRYGEVATLLQADDDRFCLVGPGDEVRIEFDAAGLPALPDGWSRSYVLRSVGYCKDADPFTAGSDEVGPLPWKGMPPFPFPPGTTRPSDPRYDAYLRDYQTRPADRR